MKKQAKAKGVSEKTFTPAHIPPSVGANRSLTETVMKEESSLQKFDANCHLYKKSRNPCNGELTPRDNAEYLIPFEKIILDKMKTTQHTDGTLLSHETVQLRSTQFGASRVAKISVQNQQEVEAMRAHKEKIDFELSQMKKAAAYKQYLLQYH